MSSKDLIIAHFNELRFSDVLSIEDFKEIIIQSKTVEVHDEDVNKWYQSYLRAEQKKLKLFRERLRIFLASIRQRELQKLEKEQLSESYNLEEIISSLYKLNEVFEGIVMNQNDELRQKQAELANFKDHLAASLDSSDRSILDSINSSIEAIEKYRKALDEGS